VKKLHEEKEVDKRVSDSARGDVKATLAKLTEEKIVEKRVSQSAKVYSLFLFFFFVFFFFFFF